MYSAIVLNLAPHAALAASPKIAISSRKMATMRPFNSLTSYESCGQRTYV
jgi:hypothetical protein